MAEPMTLQIITPDAIVFEGQSTFFVGKAIDGGFGILPNHAPMIIALDLAPLRIEQPDGTSREYAVFGGFCEIERNVLVELKSVQKVGYQILHLILM
ncbi:MAG: F0F1 ATP synthase subunit epsilon [Veillonella sp.]|nr:F0F1 ATP synthase subunit epsilon [Veillonella sp.]